MPRQYKALVWGCGQIGAGYDFDNDQVLTHAKAYALDPRFCLSVFDTELSLAQKVATKYAAERVNSLTDEALKRFDIVSLCTPTRLHFEQLLRLIALEVPVILCEKPVASQLHQLEKLQTTQLPRSRILVNYIRRFAPGYIGLRDELSNLVHQGQRLLQICVRYQRGWLNNASHAFDLIAFLFGRVPQIRDAKILQVGPVDPVLQEPTVSVFLATDLAPIYFLGLDSDAPPTFEIDLFFDACRYYLDNRGDRIRREKLAPDHLWMAGPAQTGILLNYMIPVAEAAVACLADRSEGNWAAALEVNLAMTRIFNLCR